MRLSAFLLLLVLSVFLASPAFAGRFSRLSVAVQVSLEENPSKEVRLLESSDNRPIEESSSFEVNTVSGQFGPEDGFRIVIMLAKTQSILENYWRSHRVLSPRFFQNVPYYTNVRWDPQNFALMLGPWGKFDDVLPTYYELDRLQIPVAVSRPDWFKQNQRPSPQLANWLASLPKSYEIGFTGEFRPLTPDDRPSEVPYSPPTLKDNRAQQPNNPSKTPSPVVIIPPTDNNADTPSSSSSDSSAPRDHPQWLILAKRDLYQFAELPGRARNNPKILALWTQGKVPLVVRDDETPWCAAYVSAKLELSGVRSARTPRALEYGDQQKFGPKLPGAAVGAIAVFWRKQNGKVVGGHVGFVAGKTADGRNLMLLGGNQGDDVTIAPKSEDRLVGYYWPKDVPQPKRFGLQYLPVVDSNGYESQKEV